MKIEKFLLNEILDTIREYRLVNPKDHLLLMCSGGPDSTFLLFVFNEISNLYSIGFSVFHLDHKIRKDSYKEKELLEHYCSHLGVQLFHFEEDVKHLAQKSKRNLEEFARNLRYDLAYEVAKKKGFNKLVTAHNLNDLISSFFINLLKKRHYINLFNLKPLILWKDIQVIRPLLFIPKRKITSVLEKNKISYIVDYTNFDQRMLRNSVNQGITEHVVNYLKEADNRSLFRNIFFFTEAYTESVRSLISVQYLGQKLYKLLPVSIVNEFLISESLYFHIKNILKDSFKYSNVVEVFRGRTSNIKRDWKLKKVNQEFYLFRSPYKINPIVLDLNSALIHEVKFDDLRIKLEIIQKFDCLDYQVFETIQKTFSPEEKRKINSLKHYCMALFCGSLSIRLRRNGDFFYPYGLRGKKQKIKKFLIDRKLEDFYKDRCIIFEDRYGIGLVWCYQVNLKRGRDLSVIIGKEGNFFLTSITIYGDNTKVC